MDFVDYFVFESHHKLRKYNLDIKCTHAAYNIIIIYIYYIYIIFSTFVILIYINLSHLLYCHTKHNNILYIISIKMVLECKTWHYSRSTYTYITYSCAVKAHATESEPHYTARGQRDDNVLNFINMYIRYILYIYYIYIYAYVLHIGVHNNNC